MTAPHRIVPDSVRTAIPAPERGRGRPSWSARESRRRATAPHRRAPSQARRVDDRLPATLPHAGRGTSASRARRGWRRRRGTRPRGRSSARVVDTVVQAVDQPRRGGDGRGSGRCQSQSIPYRWIDRSMPAKLSAATRSIRAMLLRERAAPFSSPCVSDDEQNPPLRPDAWLGDPAGVDDDRRSGRGRPPSPGLRPTAR